MAKANQVLRVSVLPLVVGLLGQFVANDFSIFADRQKVNKKTITRKFKSLENNDLYNSSLGIYPLLLQKDFIGFKEALAFKESQRRYNVVNKFGYLGKYQFAKGTLALVGVNNTNGFLKSPSLQERAFKANVSRNKWVLRRDIRRFVGKRIKGILITESGIVAAAHLVGPGSVKKFLRSNGEQVFKDGFGTSIIDYMDKFKSYDISDIPMNRRARVFKM